MKKISLIFLVIVIALVGLKTCGIIPNRFSDTTYVSAPQWSDAEHIDVKTKYGMLFVNNHSTYQLDIALLKELVEKHGLEFNELTLALYSENFVIQDSEEGYALTNDGGDLGGTVTTKATGTVTSVIPTGWAELALNYKSTCGEKPIKTTAAGYLTLDILHELIVHGINRAAGLEKPSGEECFAQAFERQIFSSLSGRFLVRK